MGKSERKYGPSTKARLLQLLLLCAIGVLINRLGSILADCLPLPLYLDGLGTVLVAALGGYVPGIVVGYLINIINGISDPASAYYGVLSVMIAVPDALLNKPGKLTDEEYAQIKNHTLAGKRIIARSAEAAAESHYLDEAGRLAEFHHERWDGKGYPHGRKGEDIPLSARVMAVADVFDALVSKRSYKDGFPIEKALDIIREGVGTQFDPEVAQAFLDAEEEVRRVAQEHSEHDCAAEAAEAKAE